MTTRTCDRCHWLSNKTEKVDGEWLCPVCRGADE